VFSDGLEYESETWGYCIPGDRRFHHEKVNGFIHTNNQAAK
jgi:hypothetical protein